MSNSFHRSTKNGYRLSESTRSKRNSTDGYESNNHYLIKPTNSTHELDDRSPSPSSFPTTDIVYNRDEIVLSYPEKVVPIKEPVISLDVEEEDEERIMQADWGNESDDEDDLSMQKQNKRLSTVEREEIEKQDIESKGIWIMHTTVDGRPYYYNSVSRKSAWEIPKTTKLTSAATKHTTTTTMTTTTTLTTVTDSSIPTAAPKNVAGNDQVQNQPASNTQTAKRVELKTEMQKQNDISGVITKSSSSTITNMSSRHDSSRSRDSSRDTRYRLESSYNSRRSRYTQRRSRSRSRSPLPPPPRDPYYDDYRYYHIRSPSPPPHVFRRYSSSGHYADYDDGYSPDIRYRDYEPFPPMPPPPPYYRDYRDFRYHSSSSRYYR